MDEPFGALDAQTRERLQEELVRIWEHTGTTVVFITHDIDEAVFLGQRVAVMSGRPGRIKEIVTVDLDRVPSGETDVRATPEFAALPPPHLVAAARAACTRPSTGARPCLTCIAEKTRGAPQPAPGGGRQGQGRLAAQDAARSPPSAGPGRPGRRWPWSGSSPPGSGSSTPTPSRRCTWCCRSGGRWWSTASCGSTSRPA